MHRNNLRIVAIILASALGDAVYLWADDAADKKFFEEKILPVMKAQCYDCHSKTADEVKGQFKLDTREDLRAGGESGAVLIPGEPDRSLLIKALRYEEDDRQMPPRGKLSDEIINDFVEWVKNGAVDPREK